MFLRYDFNAPWFFKGLSEMQELQKSQDEVPSADCFDRQREKIERLSQELKLEQAVLQKMETILSRQDELVLKDFPWRPRVSIYFLRHHSLSYFGFGFWASVVEFRFYFWDDFGQAFMKDIVLNGILHFWLWIIAHVFVNGIEDIMRKKGNMVENKCGTRPSIVESPVIPKTIEIVNRTYFSLKLQERSNDHFWTL